MGPHANSACLLPCHRDPILLCPHMSGLLTTLLVRSLTWWSFRKFLWGFCWHLLKFGCPMFPAVFWVLAPGYGAEDVPEGRGCGQSQQVRGLGGTLGGHGRVQPTPRVSWCLSCWVPIVFQS